MNWVWWYEVFIWEWWEYDSILKRPDKKFIFELALKLAEEEKGSRVHDRVNTQNGYTDGLEPKYIIDLIKEYTKCSEEEVKEILVQMEEMGLGEGPHTPEGDYDCEGFAKKLKAELESK